MRTFGLLLRLYPASFRNEYGEEMRALHRHRRSIASGPFEVAGLWISTVWDVLVNAARAHADILRQDLRWSSRSLTRAPGFAAAAIAVAALGIGASTASFSTLDRLLLRPLPFPDSDRIVNLWQGQRGASGYNELSPGNYRDWRTQSHSFESMAAIVYRSVNLVSDGSPARLDTVAVTSDFFRVLRVRAQIGRLFGASDFSAEGDVPIVLSDTLWRERFGADPGVLGKRLLLDDEPSIVVGVLARGFEFPDRRLALWSPLDFVEEDYAERDNTYLRGVARLRPGVPIEGARSELAVVSTRMEQAYPIENEKLEPIVWRLREQVGRQPRMLAFALFGAALCVLLIACANLAGLLLARALSRKRELAVRAALGAGRERLVRQLLTESLLVAALGGLLGIGLAWAAGPIVARVLPDALPFGEVPRVDPRALVFALAATAATGILFGLAPALRARSEAASAGLREDARAGGSRRTERLRSLLVAGEVAASVVLLVGAGLLLRALWEIQGRDPGFRTAGVLTMRTTVPLPRYEPTGERERLYRHVLSRVRELPGVESAAYISSLPMVWRGGIWGANLFENQDPAVRRAVSIRQVTPGYFQTLGIPFRRGRDIAETDGPKAQQVCVVSEAFVQEFALTQPLGQKLKVGFLEPTIVGVVGDVRVRGLERETEPQLYIASAQLPDGAMIGYFPKDLVLRTRSAASGALIPEIRRIVSNADPTVPVSDVRTLEEILRSDTGARRLQARLVAGFAALALLLAAVGIHGLLAYAVSQRTREIGVRVALGARPLQILGLILSSSGRLAGLGILAGAAVAWAFGRALIALLAGISPTDPLTLGAAIGLAVSATLVGSLVPAMRALRIDPARAMRVE